MLRRAAVLAVGGVCFGVPAMAELREARFGAPTTRYDHGVLGDAIEYGALVLVTGGGDAPRREITITLPQTRVFEDISPRLADLDGDGDAEVIVVESDLALGARLAIYDEDGLLAATDFLGRPHRWLAPLGAADLDGDGRVELAWVETPHLGKILRVAPFQPGRLVPVASLGDVTAHRIGWDWIAGGIRDCGAGPEILAASGDFARLIAVGFDGTRLAARDLGAWSQAGFETALNCR